MAAGARPAARVRGRCNPVSVHGACGTPTRPPGLRCRALPAAFRLDPQDVDPLLELADLQRSQQRHDQAAAVLAPRPSTPSPSRSERKVTSTRPWPTTTPRFRWTASSLPLMPGSAWHCSRRSASPRQWRRWERALALNPELPAAGLLHEFIGRSWQELGDRSAALLHYERALRIDPLNPQALDLLALAYFRERRYEEALALHRSGRAQPRQRADSRQRRRNPVSSGAARRSPAEHQARAGRGPGPGTGPDHPGHAPQAPSAAVAIRPRSSRPTCAAPPHLTSLGPAFWAFEAPPTRARCQDQVPAPCSTPRPPGMIGCYPLSSPGRAELKEVS